MSGAAPPAVSRDSCAYAPFYCEENIWRLAQDERLRVGGYAVFISNPGRSCALWQQQAALPGIPVVWDYHVIFIHRSDLGCAVYDFDSRLAFPSEMKDYLQQTFPSAGSIPPAFEPRFRVVDAPTLCATFTSDRSHMHADGDWKRPPPDWPIIQVDGQPPSTLERFLDVDDPFVGELMDLPDLLEWGESL